MPKRSLYYCIITLAILLCAEYGFSQYKLSIWVVDKDSAFVQNNITPPPSFKNRELCLQFIYKIPELLQAKGYITASVDSIISDTSKAFVRLYVGEAFRWAFIHTKPIDQELLFDANWNDRNFTNKPLDFQQFQHAEQQLLDYFENNGYPFARISLDSVILDSGRVLRANLKIDKGPLYKIDSIRVYGTAKISPDFLQHYLNILNGSLYKKEKLLAISKKINELPYITEQQPWNITLLGTGSVINLYLKPKRSSQIDALIGFLPSNNVAQPNRILVTGQATINLKNPFGNGESLGINWQQLQQKSPRLDLSFLQPYLFKTPYGVNFAFDLLKKDSSYLNTNAVLGLQYVASSTQTTTLFIQSLSSSLITIDTTSIIATHTLPPQANEHSINIGLSYQFNNTNYRFNPIRGNELELIGTVGNKTIVKSNQIINLKDPLDTGFSFNSLYDTIKLKSYEFRLKLTAAHYFEISRVSTLKLGIFGGLFQSPNSFLNELFLIGGYKLLRGFDEESIYAAQYATGTMEYRYLIGKNSFLFAFVDGGWAKNSVPLYAVDNTYLGIGLGMAFETKAGIFNISYAAGKTSGSSLNLRQAKIHLGYVAFF